MQKRSSGTPTTQQALGLVDPAVLGQLVGGFFQRNITKALSPLLERIVHLEARLAELGERPAPKDGAGIVEAMLNADGILLLTLSDGRILTAGKVCGSDGRDGQDAEVDYAKIEETIYGKVQTQVEETAKERAGEFLSKSYDDSREAVRKELPEIVRENQDEIALRVAAHLKAEMREVTVAEVAQQVAAIPPAKDGKDGASVTVDDMLPHLAEIEGKLMTFGRDFLTEVTSSWPIPKDGRDGKDGKDGVDGKDANVEDVLAVLHPKLLKARDKFRRKAVAYINQKIAALPKPKDGIDGKSIHPDWVKAELADQVAAAVAAIPAPKDGKDGRDAPTAEDLLPVIQRTIIERLVSDEMEPVFRSQAEIVIAANPPKDGRDGKDADPAMIQAAVQDAVAAEVAKIPAPVDGKDGKDADPEEVRALVQEHVAVAISALPPAKDGTDGKDGLPGKDGRDADPAEITRQVSEAVGKAMAELPAPKDGRDGIDGKNADPEEVQKLVGDAVSAAFATVPVPKDGRDGKDGRSVSLEEVRPVIAAEVSSQVASLEIPEPFNPEGLVREAQLRSAVAAELTAALLAMPKPADGKDGKSVTLDDVAPMIAAGIEKAIADIPPARGIESAIVDRAGSLILTFTDGRTRDCGAVAGRDVDMDEVRRRIEEEVARIPHPKDGKDGLGFDDLSLEQKDDRTFVVRFQRGDQTKEFPVEFPFFIWRGIYKPGASYVRGDAVTLGGSIFHCEEATDEKPGDTAKSWKLAVKRGRDGKDGTDLTPRTGVPLK